MNAWLRNALIAAIAYASIAAQAQTYPTKPIRVALAFTDLGSALAFLKSGRVRALAVTSRQRTALAPDIPSATEAGLPGWVAFGWFGLAAPAGTPSAVIGRLNAETTAILRQGDVRERILATYNEPSPTTPEEFGDFIRAEIAN